MKFIPLFSSIRLPRLVQFLRSHQFEFILFFLLPVLHNTHAQPLEEFIHKPDPSYSWKLEKTIEDSTQKSCTVFILDLKSQTWRTSKEVKTPLWSHYLTIVRPPQVQHKTAMLFIGNGYSHDPIPEKVNQKWIDLALNTQSVVVNINNVPNQPQVYFNDGKERKEDDSLAYSWKRFLNTQDPSWSIRLPMVKSGVRAMDAVQAFLKTPAGGEIEISDFVVSGESKRGWATWLLPAVDSRVSAIIPIVIDALNVQNFLNYHHTIYGFWAPSLKDYIHHGIISHFKSAEFSKLMEFEDPYSYINKITVPKYVINATGDQFFLPDYSPYYFKDLLGPKYLRMIPNSGHYLGNTDVYQSIEAFYSLILNRSDKKDFPRFSWLKLEDGNLFVKTIDKPSAVHLWSTPPVTKRDFRIETVGNIFTSTDLQNDGNGNYHGEIKVPTSGFVASFIELVYQPDPTSPPLKFTTEVSIVGREEHQAGTQTPAGN